MNNSVKLKNISSCIGSGITPSRGNSDYWIGGTIPWLKTEQLGEWSIYDTNEKITEQALKETSIKLYPINTISVAMYGEGKTRGNVSILKKIMATNQACCNIIIDNKKADYRFIYYYLKNKYIHLRSLSSGVRKNLNSNDLREFDVILPKNIVNQQKIADVLSVLDTKIELNNRINVELETMAKTLYDYWFVQFNFPNEQGKPYKSSGGKMVWNNELKRYIPDGWEVQEIGKYAEVKKGDLITEKDADVGFVKVVAGGISFSYTHGQANRDRNTITISGSGANAGFINFWREQIFASDCITVRGNTDTETLLLLQHLKLIQGHILNQSTGSAQPHVYPSDIRVLFYAVPHHALINNFGKQICPINDKITINIKENQKLTELRDWLLPMLMNGQIKVK